MKKISYEKLLEKLTEELLNDDLNEINIKDDSYLELATTKGVYLYCVEEDTMSFVETFKKIYGV